MLTLHEDEGGFTLVELLVVVVILAIVGGITLTGLVQGMRTSERADARLSAFADLERAGQRISRDLRRAVWSDVAVSPTGTAPQGCAYLDLTPGAVRIIAIEGAARYRLTYSLTSGTLTRTRESWSGGGWQSPSSQFVIDGLLNGDATDPIFSYLDATGTDLLADGVLDPADRASVRKFGLRLVTEVPGQDPVEYETVVGARNGGRPCPSP